VSVSVVRLQLQGPAVAGDRVVRLALFSQSYRPQLRWSAGHARCLYRWRVEG
jgi:hypothetical protein